jgi:hypothetical protein
MNTKVKAIIAAQRMPLRQAAPFLAANGVPVFPFIEAGKSPLVKHGLLDATGDATKVEHSWRRWPMASIAMPTGLTSGLDVVDVDVRETGSGFESFHWAVTRLCAENWTLRVLTPSGGTHFYSNTASKTCATRSCNPRTG